MLSLYAVLIDGAIYASAAKSEIAVKGLGNLAMHPLFREARATNQAMSGGVERSKIDNEPEIVLCAPVIGNNGFKPVNWNKVDVDNGKGHGKPGHGNGHGHGHGHHPPRPPVSAC